MRVCLYATNLRCRTALHTQREDGQTCTQDKTFENKFPMSLGKPMHVAVGCEKQDNHVLIVIGMMI